MFLGFPRNKSGGDKYASCPKRGLGIYWIILDAPPKKFGGEEYLKELSTHQILPILWGLPLLEDCDVTSAESTVPSK
jgi:hypothetical protein